MSDHGLVVIGGCFGKAAADALKKFEQRTPA
jgi:hypothetical protein